MLKQLRNTALTVAALAVASLTAAPQRAEAQTYQIDCAILLCLSGGWPASVPCARARSEFIRRITPWPVEPPLQIWRCPMGAAYTVDPDTLTSERIYEILFELEQSAPLQSFPVVEAGTPVTGIDGRLAGAPAPTFQAPPLTDGLEPQPTVVRLLGGDAAPLPEGFALQLVQDRADIDTSGAEFNFVRSIPSMMPATSGNMSPVEKVTAIVLTMSAWAPTARRGIFDGPAAPLLRYPRLMLAPLDLAAPAPGFFIAPSLSNGVIMRAITDTSR